MPWPSRHKRKKVESKEKTAATVDENRTFAEIQQDVMDAIQTVYDPEIPVNIYELGLIYEVKVNPANEVSILMTLTTPNCPAAQSLPQEVKDKAAAVPGVTSVELEVTFEPPWDQEMMSEAAKLELGF